MRVSLSLKDRATTDLIKIQDGPNSASSAHMIHHRSSTTASGASTRDDRLPQRSSCSNCPLIRHSGVLALCH